MFVIVVLFIVLLLMTVLFFYLKDSQNECKSQNFSNDDVSGDPYNNLSNTTNDDAPKLKKLLNTINNFGNKKNLNANNIDFPIFYINLNRSLNRKLYIEESAKKYNLNIKRIKAVNGKKLNKSNGYLIFNKQKFFYENTYDNSGSQLGCLFSHLKTLYEFLNFSSNEWCLILEDDASFDLFPYVTKSLNQIVDSAPIDWEYISLFCFDNYDYNISNFLPWNDKTARFPSCLAYIVNRKGAINILQKIIVNNRIILKKEENKFKHIEADYILHACSKTYLFTEYCYFFPNYNFYSTIGENSKINEDGYSEKNIRKYLKKFIIHKNKFNNNRLGNRFLEFFVFLNNFFIDNENINFFNTLQNNVSNSILISRFPEIIQRPVQYNINNFKISINPETVWEAERKYTKNFFINNYKLMRNVVETSLSYLKYTLKNQIAIHFRCSDVPFNRHPSYEFPMYRFYKKNIDYFLTFNNNPNKIIILTNSLHLTNNKNFENIKKYQNYLLNFLQKTYEKLNITLRDNCDIEEDFEIMRKSRFLLTPSSSFSFCAAITGSQERAILMKPKNLKEGPVLPNHIISVDCDSLSHSSVQDYGDYKSVNNALKL